MSMGRRFARPTTQQELWTTKRNGEWIDVHSTRLDKLDNKIDEMREVELARARVIDRPDNRYIWGIVAGFVIPILMAAAAIGSYPKRSEVISIIVRQTSPTERELRRVEQTVRADIARIKKQIDKLGIELATLAKAQLKKNRRRR